MIKVTIGRSYRRCVNDFASSLLGHFGLIQFRPHRQVARLPDLRVDEPLEFLAPAGRGEPVTLGCGGDGQGDRGETRRDSASGGSNEPAGSSLAGSNRPGRAPRP